MPEPEVAVAPPACKPRPRREVAVLVLAILGAGGLLFHGQLVSSDEILMMSQAVALTTEGRLTFPELYGRTTSPYGILCAVQGTPWVALQLGLDRMGLWGGSSPPALPTLANVINLLLLGLYFRAWSRRVGASEAASTLSALALCLATPLLPYAQSFFSEPATALALVGIGYHLRLGWAVRCSEVSDAPRARPRTSAPLDAFRVGLWMAAGAHLRVITGVLWPLWFAVAWRQCRAEGLSPRDAARVLLRMAVFPALGVVGLLGINQAVRGSLLNFGYETSDFTTPAATGLHGLLFSPERGLFVQVPLIWLALAGWGLHWRRAGFAARAIAGVGVIWLAFHATFWTWHGGWTPGPRFLLPLLPLLFLSVPLLLDRWRDWGGGRKALVLLVAAWGAAQALAQTLVNPLDWNNELWGLLGQVESRFLFEPQVGSWRGMWTLLGDGAPRPVWLTGGGREGLPGLAIWGFPLVGLILWVGAVAAAGPGKIGTELKQAGNECLAWMHGAGRIPTAVLALWVIILVPVWLLSGPRGLERTLLDAEGIETRLDRRLREARQPGDTLPPDRRWERIQWKGYMDLPLDGEYGFYLKARGRYRIAVAGKVVFANADAEKPQHLDSGTLRLSPGRYPVEIMLEPSADQSARMHLYWKWPGEGRLLEAVSGEYLLPRELTGMETLLTRLRRRALPLTLTIAVTAGLLAGLRRRNHTEVTKES